MTKEELRELNKDFCEPNKHCLFLNAVPVTTRNNYGYDNTRLDLEFKQIGGTGRRFHISIFDVRHSAQDRIYQSSAFHSLCDALGTDFGWVFPCHGIEDFIQELVDDTIGEDGEPFGLLVPHKGKKVFIKLTINDKGFFKFGTGKCVSNKPDMFYSDEDRRFLDEGEETPLSDLDSDTSFMKPKNIPF